MANHSDTTNETSTSRDCRPKRVFAFKDRKFVCLSCKMSFDRTGSLQKRCGPCSREFNLQKKRDEQAAKTGSSYRPLGSEVLCDFCGNIFLRSKPQQKYCDGCGVLARRQVSRDCCRAYYKKNNAKLRKYGRDRYSDVKEYVLASRDCEEYRKRRRIVAAEKYKSDPRRRLNMRMSGNVSRFLKSGKQGVSWRKMVPYTPEILIVHLERQFTKGMTWKNYGKWEIDHILPLSSFEMKNYTDPDFQAAWALCNLRPLWKIDNRKKHATRTHLV